MDRQAILEEIDRYTFPASELAKDEMTVEQYAKYKDGMNKRKAWKLLEAAVQRGELESRKVLHKSRWCNAYKVKAHSSSSPSPNSS